MQHSGVYTRLTPSGVTLCRISGDMFLIWAQQWYYIARAMTMGYSVLRADTDVYLAEDPYPILHSPLLRPFSLVVQQDFGGPLGGRPACWERNRRPRHHPNVLRADLRYSSTTSASRSAVALPHIASCGVHRGTSLLNIGLVYARAAEPGGGGLAVINGTWARFLALLSQSRSPPGKAAHSRHVEELIDQPLMR